MCIAGLEIRISKMRLRGRFLAASALTLIIIASA